MNAVEIAHVNTSSARECECEWRRTLWKSSMSAGIQSCEKATFLLPPYRNQIEMKQFWLKHEPDHFDAVPTKPPQKALRNDRFLHFRRIDCFYLEVISCNMIELPADITFRIQWLLKSIVSGSKTSALHSCNSLWILRSWRIVWISAGDHIADINLYLPFFQAHYFRLN